MKKGLYLGFAAILVLAACNNPQQAHTDELESHANESHATESASTTPAQLKDEKLQAVNQHYIHLSTALTKGDATEAKAAANAIEVGAKEINGGSEVAASAARIASASNLADQRKEFSKLSDLYIPLVKKTGLASGELYVEYCPMANDNNGAYWLSNNKEIRNPYFGDEMLTCGEVKETIK